MERNKNAKITHRFINDSEAKPVSVACIATYLAMADEGIIQIPPEEYSYFKRRLDYLTQNNQKNHQNNS